MTPDQILARLQSTFPNLDWEYKDSPTCDLYDGRARDEQGSPIFSLMHWKKGAAVRSGCVELWVVGSPRPRFAYIESAFEWLEWFQSLIAR